MRDAHRSHSVLNVRNSSARVQDACQPHVAVAGFADQLATSFRGQALAGKGGEGTGWCGGFRRASQPACTLGCLRSPLAWTTSLQLAGRWEKRDLGVPGFASEKDRLVDGAEGQRPDSGKGVSRQYHSRGRARGDAWGPFLPGPCVSCSVQPQCSRGRVTLVL